MYYNYYVYMYECILIIITIIMYTNRLWIFCGRNSFLATVVNGKTESVMKEG